VEQVSRDRLPFQIIDLYQHYSFEAWDRSAAFAYNDRAEWAQAARQLSATLLDAVQGLDDRGLVAAESEHARKMCTYWRDKGLGSIVQDTALISDNEDQARVITPTLRAWGIKLAGWVLGAPIDLLKAAYTSAAVPVDRGKGAPFWLPSSDREAAIELHALWEGAHDVTAYFRHLSEAGPMMVRPCLTGYIRIQDAQKPVPRWELTGGELTRTGTRIGPKVRKVQAAPFGLNSIMAGCADIARVAGKSIDSRNAGDLAEVERVSRSSKLLIAMDYSNYDDSVSHQTIRAFHLLILEPLLRACRDRGVVTPTHYRQMLSVDEYMTEIPFLGPPRDHVSGAQLTPTNGGIKSGGGGRL